MKKICSLLSSLLLTISIFCIAPAAEVENYLSDYINMDWVGDGVFRDTEKGVIYFERDREKPKYAELSIDLSAISEKPKAMSFSFKAGNLYALPKENSRDSGRVKISLSNGTASSETGGGVLQSYSTADIDSNRYYESYLLNRGGMVEIPTEATKIVIELSAVWESGECTDVYFKDFELKFYDEYTAPSETPITETAEGVSSEQPTEETAVKEILSDSFMVIDTLEMTDMTTEPSETSRMFIAMVVMMVIVIVYITINRVFRYFFPKKKKGEERKQQPTQVKAPRIRYKREQRFFAVTAADIEQGNLKKITEPLTLLINITMDRFELERASERFSEPQKTLAAVKLYIGEVQSGGHEKLFATASADFLKLVGEALSETGLNALNDIFDKACAVNRAGNTDKLNALDKELHSTYSQEQTDDTLKKYVQDNAEEFLFDGYIEVKTPIV